MAGRRLLPIGATQFLAGMGAVSTFGVAVYMQLCNAAQHSQSFEIGDFGRSLIVSAWIGSPYFGIFVLTKMFAKRRPSSMGALMGGSIVITLLGEWTCLSTVMGLIATHGYSNHMGGSTLMIFILPLFQWPLLGVTTLVAAISGGMLFRK